MKIGQILVMIFLLNVVAIHSEAEIIGVPTGIILPNPVDLSEVSAFTPEWCAQNSELSNADGVCFGRAQFQGAVSVRAFAITNQMNQRFLYVENGIPSVDLLNLEFSVIGPVIAVSQGATPQAVVRMETGNVQLTIDENGEVDGIFAWTPMFGTIRAARP